ncbi:MAG: 30S ribosomal protein S6 [Acidobacteria bacterium]|jgi:small subunit ribosomal protein S6|nr:30S ribosomal protein S6 [Acidobacteriota bacterium]MCS5701713.1 30S ribosomal protein S6 [Acidobacteriota bacterium]|tara:strand:- start:13762 stop:14436 length:675 start_codon:yes stop_codon:yes gene_type:complete
MQNFYETLLIVAPEADEEGVSAVIGDLRAAIESDGGTVLQARVWERRKLAYMVKGKTDGIYVLIHAEGERTLPAVLKDRMKLDESVIRSMVVRLKDQQEIDVRQEIAERDHAGDATVIEEQRAAAERRHEAEAVAAAMSLDEIVAAEEAEAEAVDSDDGDLGDDVEAEAADSDDGDSGDDAEAADGDDEAATVEISPVDESDDDVAVNPGDTDDTAADDEGKEG